MTGEIPGQPTANETAAHERLKEVARARRQDLGVPGPMPEPMLRRLLEEVGVEGRNAASRIAARPLPVLESKKPRRPTFVFPWIRFGIGSALTVLTAAAIILNLRQAPDVTSNRYGLLPTATNNLILAAADQAVPRVDGLGDTLRRTPPEPVKRSLEMEQLHDNQSPDAAPASPVPPPPTATANLAKQKLPTPVTSPARALAQSIQQAPGPTGKTEGSIPSPAPAAAALAEKPVATASSLESNRVRMEPTLRNREASGRKEPVSKDVNGAGGVAPDPGRSLGRFERPAPAPRRNFNSPGQPPVLLRFEIFLDGQTLQCVDADGSVLKGPWQATPQGRTFRLEGHSSAGGGRLVFEGRLEASGRLTGRAILNQNQALPIDAHTVVRSQ